MRNTGLRPDFNSLQKEGGLTQNTISPQYHYNVFLLNP